MFFIYRAIFFQLSRDNNENKMLVACPLWATVINRYNRVVSFSEYSKRNHKFCQGLIMCSRFRLTVWKMKKKKKKKKKRGEKKKKREKLCDGNCFVANDHAHHDKKSIPGTFVLESL